jgi:hypothetical protein
LVQETADIAVHSEMRSGVNVSTVLKDLFSKSGISRAVATRGSAVFN